LVRAWLWRLVPVLWLMLAGCGTVGPDARLSGSGVDAAGAQLVRLGALALERGEAATAAGLLARAVQLRPADVEAATLYGRALLALGRARDAAEVWRSVLDRQPDARAARLGFARAMLQLGRPEVAVEQLRPLWAAAGGVEVANLLGVALVHAGRPAEAVTVLDQARRAAPEDLRVLHNLALALAFAERFAEAEALLRPLAEGPGSTRQARQNLALVLGLAGQFEAAARLMRVDLDDAAVAGNLAFLRLLAAGDRRPARLAALIPPARPQAADIVTFSPPQAAAGGEGPAALAPETPSAALAARPPHARLAKGSEAGPSRAAAPAAPAPAQAPSPTPAGSRPPADGALAAADLARGAPPVGAWMLRLGLYGDEARAAAAWRQLQQRFPAELTGLMRLRAAEPGPQPLLVGPLEDGAEAKRLCATLRAGGASCDPLRL
jgi:Flp pilus assembly protein TadD